jgi:sulfoxide reductase catalytic subunit YedY
MLIRTRRSWELPESSATPEAVYLNRRQLLKGAACVAGATLLSGRALGAEADPSAHLYPARHPRPRRQVSTEAAPCFRTCLGPPGC